MAGMCCTDAYLSALAISNGQNLGVPLLSAWTKPIDGTIESEMMKARQEIVS